MGRYLSVKQGGDFKGLEDGNYVAVCDQVVLLGYHRDEWKGKPKINEKVYIRWQVPSERVKWGKDGEEKEGPAIIGETLNISMFPLSNLRKFLEGWRGKVFTDEEQEKFDIKTIIGKACMIQVLREEGKTRSHVKSVATLPKGMTPPAVEGPTLFFDIDDYTEAQINALRPWQKEMIEGGVDMNAADPGGIIESMASDNYDDIPF